MSRYDGRGGQWSTKRGEEMRDAIIAFIRDFIDSHDGCRPTQPLIAKALDTNAATICYHLGVLEQRGDIFRYDDLSVCNIGFPRKGPRFETVQAESFFDLRDKLYELERQGYTPVGEPVVVQMVMQNGAGR